MLDQPATSEVAGITPAPLLPVGFLDANQGALKNETFTLVGYGVDIGAKKAQIVNQQRMSTTAPLKSVQSRGRGVPEQREGLQGGRRVVLRRLRRRRVLEQYVIGDASYVNSLTCNATGTYQRVDTPYSRAFLDSWIAQAG